MKYLALITAACLAAPALAHSYVQKAIQIGHAWGLPSAGSDTQIFFPVLNAGKAEDALIAMSTPAAANARFVASNGALLQPLPLVPGKPVGMRKGGAHIRLMGLKKPLAHGDRIPLILTFAKAGRITVEVWIEPAPYAKKP